MLGSLFFNSVDNADDLLRSSASQACPICRKPLGNTDLAAFPPNYDLRSVIENLRQFHEAIPSEISPEHLQLTDEIIGRGACGVVRCGVLRIRDVPFQVGC